MAQVKDAMTTKIKTIHPEAAIKEAAAEMKAFDTGAIPVVEEESVIGMLTDRDITVRVVAAGNDPNTVKVQEVMTRGVETGFEDQNLDEVMGIMKDKQIRRVVVLNRENKLTGVCSLGDLATYTKAEAAGDVLDRVSRPGNPDQ